MSAIPPVKLNSRETDMVKIDRNDNLMIYDYKVYFTSVIIFHGHSNVKTLSKLHSVAEKIDDIISHKSSKILWRDGKYMMMYYFVH